MERLSEILRFPGSPDPTHRLNMIAALLQDAETKVNHFDNMRHATLLLALSLFGGVLSFSVSWGGGNRAALACISVAVIILILLVRDRRIHAYSEGWQSTRIQMIRAMRDIVNKPDEEVSFPRYHEEEEKAALFGSSRWPYLLIIVAAVVASAAFSAGFLSKQP